MNADALLDEISKLRELARRHAQQARNARRSRDYWRTRARAAEWANRNQKEPQP